MAATRPWLVGPATDLLFGCGVLYMGVFAAFAFAGPELRGMEPAALTLGLALLLSTPHYGATLLRVYDQAADRRRYRFFAVHVTGLVAILFGIGLYSLPVASALFTLFLLWSPWHYTGQNYGLAVMFLRRRGLVLEPGLKRLVYASFVLSWLFFVLVVRAGGDASVGAQGGIRLYSLPIPDSLRLAALAGAGVGYLATLAASAFLLLRRASARTLLPVAMLCLTQSLWFSIPAAVQLSGRTTGIEPIDVEFQTYTLAWIALGHAIQYLWITTYYAKGSPGWEGSGHYLGKTLIVGSALWTLPLVLFAPWSIGGLLGGVLGRASISGDAGFYLLLSACINIQHFVLDGAIWKLRDSRIARILLRDATSGASDERGSLGVWPRRVVWAVAGLGALLAVAQFDRQAKLLEASRNADLAASTAALDALDWFGLDSAEARRRIARLHLEREELAPAASSLRASLRLAPDVGGYSELAYIETQRGDHAAALDALRRGLRLEPDRLGLLHRAGEALLALGRPAEARSMLERAVEVDPSHEPSRRALARARRQQRRTARAEAAGALRATVDRQ